MKFVLTSLLISSLFIFNGCSSVLRAVLKEPKVTFRTVDVRNATAEGAVAVLKFDIENPNGIGVTVDQLDYTLELGGRKISSAGLKNVAEIKAHTTSPVEVPVPFRYSEVFASILDLMTSGTAVYKVTGAAKVGMFNLPFDEGGEVKLRQ